MPSFSSADADLKLSTTYFCLSQCLGASVFSPTRRRGDNISKLSSKLGLASIAVLVFAADQVSKIVVERRVSPHALVRVIPGFFNIINTKNSGAVFGMFSDSAAWWKAPLLIGVSLVLLATVVTMVARTPNLNSASGIGLALVLGGALANLLDRIRVGEVEDFLDFYFRSYHWYTFNVADAAIVVGTGMIVLQLLLGG